MLDLNQKAVHPTPKQTVGRTMKRPNNRSSVIAVGLVLGTLSGPLMANVGPYVGVAGGLNLARGQHFDYRGQSTRGPQPPLVVERPLFDNDGPAGDYTFKRSPLGQLVIGTQFANGLRPEFELSLRRERTQTITFPDQTVGSNAGVQLSTTTGFGNLWYDLFPQWRLHPYVGGGFGVARQILNNFQTNVETAPPRKADDASLAYQFGGGVRFDLTSHFSIGLDYRWVKTFNTKLFPYEEQPQTFFRSHYNAQSVLFSVQYFIFGKPKPPAAEPVAPVEVVALVAPVDTDGDGVPDDVDQCPDSPAGSVVDATGCPPPPPPPPAPTCKQPGPGEKVSLAGCGAGDSIVLRGVNFATNKAVLTVNAKTILDDVVAELKAHPEVEIAINGHTDSDGSDASNQKLSERRAASVMAYLVSQGIAANRMVSAGFGEGSPVADNATAEGKELNRRVELKITKGIDDAAAAGAPAAP